MGKKDTSDQAIGNLVESGVADQAGTDPTLKNILDRANGRS
jgi:hypothetical protein